MSRPAISVQNLSKMYKIHKGRDRVRNLRDLVSIQRLKRRSSGKTEDLWALKDVSFEVAQGESIGVIGRNGAGKSTLLKVLSRIVEPTSGRIEYVGRIGSLLEVGTGFHPELSGRQNIYLNGAILGMSRGEISSKLDEIVAFSEIERFLDEPVKHYSSGMYVRLAFAVAAHLDSDILLIDEVLAVGDMAFQKKCLNKMSDVTQKGRTIVFISHNIQAISQFTERCLVVDGGRIAFDGDTKKAIDLYNEQLKSAGGSVFQSTSTAPNRVLSAEVMTSEKSGVHQWGQPITFKFRLDIRQPREALCFSIAVLNRYQQRVCHLWYFVPEAEFKRNPGTYTLTCEVPKFRLFMGDYTLSGWLTDRRGNEIFDRFSGVCGFEVSMVGVHRPGYDWRAEDCAYIEEFQWTSERRA